MVAVLLVAPSLFLASFFIPVRYEIVNDLGILVLIEDKVDPALTNYPRPYLRFTFVNPDTYRYSYEISLTVQFDNPIVGNRYALFRAVSVWGLTIAGKENWCIVLPFE